MKSRTCPYKKHCHSSGDCENCDFGKAFENLSKKIKRLKDKNKALQAENEELKTKIEVLENPDF
jgi:predicted RNase H-like nuclease (RuvC/YqgF family)